VLVAYDDMGREWDSAVYENEWRRPLYSALFNLRDAIGVPVESGGE
jgi:hypothetical protein